MIDIEHGALGAFEHDGLAVADGVVEQQGGVAHHGAYAFREGLILGADGVEVEFAIDAEGAGDDAFSSMMESYCARKNSGSRRSATRMPRRAVLSS